MLAPFMATQNGCSYYGVDFEECGGSDLALTCELRGPFCCEPSSVIETPKMYRRSGIDVQMDVVWLCELISIEEGDPILVGEMVEPKTELDMV